MPVDNQRASVWSRPEKRRREHPALSREQIVAEAIRLLDEQGLDALSMRNLGTRLGAGATSLYTHVANKDELLELVVDEVYGEITVAPSEDPADWTGPARQLAVDLRATILRHPWLVAVLGHAGLQHLGPNLMSLVEDILTRFERAGFTLRAGNQAISMLSAYVVGITTTEAAWLTMLARGGHDEVELVQQFLLAGREAVRPYPRLRELHESYDQLAPADTREDSFTVGLDCLLDGMATRLKT
ncbi:TetR/AcrR family transcriptional regulator [Longispora sp. NPDC051575]|uniref:TetR/AcrR family transcriptional regulator n=1 Tax=Longispora sp. NPDC051575 TaxID=3154943 RepID=UPI0034209AF8